MKAQSPINSNTVARAPQPQYKSSSARHLMTTQGPNQVECGRVATTMQATRPKTTETRRVQINSNRVAPPSTATKMLAAMLINQRTRNIQSTRMRSRAQRNHNASSKARREPTARKTINSNAVAPSATTMQGAMPETKWKRSAQSTRTRSRADVDHNASDNVSFQMTAQSPLNSDTVARLPQPQCNRQHRKLNESARPNHLKRDRKFTANARFNAKKPNESAEPDQLEYGRAATATTT